MNCFFITVAFYFIIYYENTNFIMLVGINSTKQIEISNFTYGTKWDKLLSNGEERSESFGSFDI